MENDQNAFIIIELQQVKPELADYWTREEGSRAQEKKVFLESEELFDSPCSDSTTLFEYGFERATQQFKEAGNPPEGTSPDFLDLHKALNNILQEKFRSD